MATYMELSIWDVEHGACATLCPITDGVEGRIAMIDCGHNETENWRPANYLRGLGRSSLDYFINTNADQDHLSGLDGLWDAGIGITTFIRNSTITGPNLRAIKEPDGRLTNDLERLVQLHTNYTAPNPFPFDQNMGGITLKTFFNSYPALTDTNDLSLVAFITFGGFTICFPGDLGRAGWEGLLAKPDFQACLRMTKVLVASHHGRSSGFFEGVFNFCQPIAVVISDKELQFGSQETVPQYRAKVQPRSILNARTNSRRHVLTTRKDGWMKFAIFVDGTYMLHTECG
jgi:beta-lactamase superfamily II metal-dependent hydrolase